MLLETLELESPAKLKNQLPLSILSYKGPRTWNTLIVEFASGVLLGEEGEVVRGSMLLTDPYK